LTYRYTPKPPSLAMERQQGYVLPESGVWWPRPALKRLIVCCDGTWQAFNHATHEVPSNVAKLSHAISKTYIDEHYQAAPQIVFYDASLATAGVFEKASAGRSFPPSLFVKNNRPCCPYARNHISVESTQFDV